MKLEILSDSLAKLDCSVLAVYSYEGSAAASGTAALLPGDTRALLEELQSGGELTGKAFECTLVHRPAGMAARKLLVVGAGKKEKFDTAQLGRLAGTATRFARARSIHDLAWAVEPESDAPAAVQAAAEGALVADYDADPYRTERNGERRIERFIVAAGSAASNAAARQALERGRIIGEAQNWVRDLVNEPSNNMTPSLLAEHAQKMCADFGLECQVLGEREIRAEQMGALMAVAQGSEQPPRMIVVRYAHPEAPAQPVVGLVGKGVTFDTGGISIKPSEAMHEMKTDMAGGATMLGVMRVIAQLKPRARVTALVPAAENMPSGRAYRPGDVVKSMSGKTIEILNTDAEGRLLLADALTYAQKLGCTVLIDAATLTGAITIALGNITTGVFGWNQEWVDRLLASARATGEKMWPMPVHDDYRELYKSMIADLANTGGRYGGAITAAMFVGEFAGESPWVHLDIAGTRWSNEEKPYRAKGPTGAVVPTLVHLITHLSGA